MNALLCGVLALGLLSRCGDARPNRPLQLVNKTFEDSQSRLVATGSWQSHPAGWQPYASVEIDCTSEPRECIEFWASLVSDEHGRNPDSLVPEMTRYSIVTWSSSEIVARAMFRDRWPVELQINRKTGAIKRSYVRPEDRHDGADYWTLE